MKELFAFSNNVKAIAYHRMDNKTIKKLWDSFTLSEVSLDMTHCDDFVFKVGDVALPALEDGKEYYDDHMADAEAAYAFRFGLCHKMRCFYIFMGTLRRSAPDDGYVASPCQL